MFNEKGDPVTEEEKLRESIVAGIRSGDWEKPKSAEQINQQIFGLFERKGFDLKTLEGRVAAGILEALLCTQANRKDFALDRLEGIAQEAYYANRDDLVEAIDAKIDELTSI